MILLRDSLYSIVVISVLATSLAGTSFAKSEEPGSNLPPQSEASASASSTEAPRIPILSPEVVVGIEKVGQLGLVKTAAHNERKTQGSAPIIAIDYKIEHESVRLSKEEREEWGKHFAQFPHDESIIVITEVVLDMMRSGLMYFSSGRLLREGEVPDTDETMMNFAETVVAWRVLNQGERSWLTIDAAERLKDLQMLRKVGRGDQLPYLEAHRTMAELDLLVHIENSEEAIARLDHACKTLLRLRGEEHRMYAECLTRQAMYFQELGQYDQAEQRFQRAAEIVKAGLGTEHPAYGLVLNQLGTLAEVMGRTIEAENYHTVGGNVLARAYQELSPTALLTIGLPIVEANIRIALSNGRHGHQGKSISQLSDLVRDMRDAYLKTEESRSRWPTLDQSIQEEDHQSNIHVYKYAEWRWIKRFPAVFAKALEALAGLYTQAGRYEEAEPLYEEAREVWKKEFGTRHPGYAASLGKLGKFYSTMKRYESAETHLQEAIEIQKVLLGKNHIVYATALRDFGTTLMAAGKTVEAATVFLESMQAQWAFTVRILPALSEKRKLEFLNGYFFDQADLLLNLVFRNNATRATQGLAGDLLRKQLLAEVAREENSALQRVLAIAPSNWRKIWQEREALRREYAVFALQSMTENSFSHMATTSESTRDPERVRALADQIEQLDQQLRRENPMYAEAARLQEITVDQVTQGLRRDQAHVEYVQFHAWDEQTKQLSRTKHFGVYVLRGDQAPVVAIDLGEVTLIDAAVGQIQQRMRILIDQSKQLAPSRKQLRQSEAELAEISSTLRKLIWEPLEANLKGINRVYVAPEGQLSLIPFEMLVRKTKQGHWRYLVEDRDVVYVNTGRDLARLALTTNPRSSHPGETPSTSTAVLVSNPAFGAKPQEVAQIVAGLPSAPVRVAQVDEISEKSTLGMAKQSETARHQIPRTWGQYSQLDHLLKKAQTQLQRAGWAVTTLTQNAAVEEAVLRVQAPRILQLATHGYLLDHIDTSTGGWDNPLLRSMLLLTGVNHADPQQQVFYRVGTDVLAEADARKRGLSKDDLQQARIDIGDGILTAYEVTSMNLQGTELVNLTACETGLGEVTPDGVIGLRQAFMLAGARALTTSLWEVPVDETTQQIESFYTRWLGDGKYTKPKPRYAAFRETQLEALAQAREQHGAGHPFFWAGTIYLGDPGDLPTQAQSLKR